MDFTSILNIINKVIVGLYGVTIGFGCLSLLYGIILCFFNRRVIKALYFVAGFLFFSLISLTIGIVIISNKNYKLDSETGSEEYDKLVRDLLITAGCSGGIGLITGILTACFGRFGIVLVGITIGTAIGLIIGIAVNNLIAVIVLSIVLAIIGGVICGVFKRPAEVLTSAIMGGICSASGYYLIFTGTLDLQLYNHLKKQFGVADAEAFEKLAIEGGEILERTEYLVKVARISGLVIGIVFIVVFGLYHIITYKKNHSKLSEKNILLRKSPAYNPI